MRAMRVLAIGGSGFIGQRVAEVLGEAGHEVWSLSRHPSEGRHIVADRESPADFAAAVRGRNFDAVVDLAAYHPRDVTRAVDLFSDHIIRYIFISSGVVHRDLHGISATEDDVLIPRGDPPDEPLGYILGKRWCEAVLARARSEGFPGVSIRPAAVIGAGDPTGRVVAYLARIEDGGPLLVPGGLFDRGIGVVWNRDIGGVCARVLEVEPPSGAYNVAFPDLSIRRFAAEAAAALGASPPQLADVGEEALRNAGLKLGEVSPYGPYRERSSGYDLSRLRSELGVEPSPLGMALQDVVDWYRNDRPEAPGYGSRKAELELARRG